MNGSPTLLSFRRGGDTKRLAPRRLRDSIRLRSTINSNTFAIVVRFWSRSGQEKGLKFPLSSAALLCIKENFLMLRNLYPLDQRPQHNFKFPPTPTNLFLYYVCLLNPEAMCTVGVCANAVQSLVDPTLRSCEHSNFALAY